VAAKLTLSQVLETQRRAYSQGLLYRFVPGRGFDRANTLARSWGLGWLPLQGTPQVRSNWFHESRCDCQYCRSAVKPIQPTEEQHLKAA
jgi:hypothetical protein